MQTVTFDISAKPPASLVLWRAIPATVTLTGLGETSGDWKCIVTAGTWDDATLLTGEVTAGTAPGALTVTFAAMDSAPLAAAIKGSATLSCVATLTDSVSRVLLIPLCIRNRATDVQPPPPPSQTYVNSVNGETGDVTLGASDVGALPDTTTAADVGAIPAPATAGTAGQVLTVTEDGAAWEDPPAAGVSSVNGETGAVTLTAADVEAVSLDGLPIEALTSGVIPGPGKVYTLAPSADAEITFPAPVVGKTNAFGLRITMPDPAIAVTWPAGLVWRFAAPTLAAGTTSELAFAWTGSAWEGWATPDMSEYLTRDHVFPSDGSGNIVWFNASNFRLLTITDLSVAAGYRCLATGAGGGAFGNSCQAGRYCTAVGGNSVYVVNNGNGTAMGYHCTATTANKSVYGRYNIDPAENTMIALGCGTATTARDDAWRILTDKTFEIVQAAVFDGEVTFTPAGKAATTLTALEARIAALEAAQN